MVLASMLELAGAAGRQLPAMLDVALRSAVVLAVAWLAVAMMRRMSASTRHWGWVLGMAAVVLMPGAVAVVPGWRVLPRMGHQMGQAVAAREVTVIEVPAFTDGQPGVVGGADRVASGQPRAAGAGGVVTANGNAAAAAPERVDADSNRGALAPVKAAGTSALPSETSAPKPNARSVAHAANVQADAGASLTWTFWAVAAWIAGTFLAAGHVMLGHLSLWLLRRKCVRLTDEAWTVLLEQVRQEMGIARSVELLSSPLRTMPMTWGLWRARLLVPAQATAWPAEQRRAVLLHELGHVRRWDCLTQLLAQMACAMYWFNPLVWTGWKRMQVERERACDDLVLSTGARASAYARHLLESASAVPVLRLVGAAALAMARASTLEERMRAILDGKRNRRGMTGRGVLATVAVMMLVLVPVAALEGQAATGAAAASNSMVPPSPPGYAGDAVPLPPGYPGIAPLSRQGHVATSATQDETTATASVVAGGRATGVTASAQGGDVTPGARSATLTSTAAPGEVATPAAPARGARNGAGFTGGTARGAVVPATPAAAPVLGEGPTCPLDATIYDVRLPVEKIGQLDVEALTKASADAAGFEKALAELGPTVPLYRVNQSVRLASDTIMVGTQTPYVTNSQVTASGQTINSVSFTQMGGTFSMAGKVGAGNSMELDLKVAVSAMTDSGTAISSTVKAPMFRNATMSHKGPVEARQAFVLLSVDAASVDANGKAVAFITRVTLGAPQ